MSSQKAISGDTVATTQLQDVSLEMLFLQIEERRRLNEVPLCRICSTKKNLSNPPAAVVMCIKCYPSVTLCVRCSLEENDPQWCGPCKHQYVPLKDVYFNIYNAALGLPVNPINITARTDTHKQRSKINSCVLKTATRLCHSGTKTTPAVPNKTNLFSIFHNTHLKSTDFIRTPKPCVSNPIYQADINLSWPYGLCTSPNGSVFIADTYNHRTLVVNTENIVREIRKKNDGHLLSYPVGLHSSISAGLAVADTGNGSVCIFNPDGKLVQEIRKNLRQPHGVVYGSWYVLVADISQRSLTKHSCLDGRVVQTLSEPGHGTAESEMRQPSYVECSSDGRMTFAADTAGHCVKVFDNSSGNVVKTIGSFEYPHGLCIDPEQRTLIVADYGRSSVDAVDLRKGSIVSEVAGLNKGVIGPTDVAYHVPSRQVLVLDTTRSKILQYPLLPLTYMESSNLTQTDGEQHDWLKKLTPRIVFSSEK